MKIIVWKDTGSYVFDASAQTITFSWLDTINIRDVVLITNVTDNIIIYNFASAGKWGTITSQVLTLDYDTTSMDDSDELQILLDVWEPFSDFTTWTNKITNQNPTPSYYQQIEWRDGTNLPATTNYYPSALWLSMDQYKNFSISGKMIDADGTMTLTVEGTNDEDQTNADRVQMYWLNTFNNTMENSRAVTNGTLTYAIKFDTMNFQFVRVKMINNGATNTFILKLRQVY